MVQHISVHATGKIIVLTIWTSVSKVISLLFNTLSRFNAFFFFLICWHSFPSMKLASFNFMAAVTVCSDFGAQENCHCFHSFPFYLPWSGGTRPHDLHFLMLNFKPAFSLSSFTLIKRIFSCSSLSAITVVSSAYLRFLIFLLAVLIPACTSFSPVFRMMYSAHKLNKQGDNI